MLKKNNLNFRRQLFLLILVICLTSCKKEVPPKFSGDNFLYFMNAGSQLVLNSSNIHLVYVPEQKFSFFDGFLQKDTLIFDNHSDFFISIQADGKLTAKNRKISLELAGSGKEFVILPPPDSIYVKGGELAYKLNLKLVRPLLSDTGLKTITLTLKNNDEFSPENHSWSKITYKFGNLVLRNRNYDQIEDSYGDFSAAKIRALQYASDRAGAAFWNSDSNVEILNDFLKQRNEREVKFDPFNLNELYYFMDCVYFVAVLSPPGPVRDAYKDIAKKMISVTNVYLKEQKAAGKPILDEQGREIKFPENN